MFAPELSTSAIALAAITQLPDGGGAAGAVKPAARQGRSEAEWLDRAEDRRTIGRCDGRTLWPPGAQRGESTFASETRGLEDCEEVTAGDRLRR